MKKVCVCLALGVVGFLVAGGSKKTVFENATYSGVEKLSHKSNDKLVDKSRYKTSLSIPESIKKDVPKDMWNTVFLQLIFNLLKNEYVYEMSDLEMTEKALKGLLSELDMHSCYMDEKDFELLKTQTDGEFGGLGIEIVMDGGFVRVISPIDDTPAYKAGLKSGDLILYVNDECIYGMSSTEILSKLRGKPKTKVKLRIKRRDKNPFSVVVERDMIKVTSVKSEVLDDIGYVRISTFDTKTGPDLKKVLESFRKQNLKGIVLDLRNNPGGLLDAAVAVSNMFLKGGKIVSIRGRTDECTKYYAADGVDLSDGLPVVVLINDGSASASEIVAGALRDNKRAVVVGVRSFGKGSVQKVIPLSEKTAIKLTIAKYYMPNGDSIQGKGVEPDIEAHLGEITPISTIRFQEIDSPKALDADLLKVDKKKIDMENQKIIDDLEKNNDKKIDKNDDLDAEITYRKLPLNEKVQKDYQLNKAFDVIKILSKYSITSLDPLKEVDRGVSMNNSKKSKVKTK